MSYWDKYIWNKIRNIQNNSLKSQTDLKTQSWNKYVEMGMHPSNKRENKQQTWEQNKWRKDISDKPSNGINLIPSDLGNTKDKTRKQRQALPVCNTISPKQNLIFSTLFDENRILSRKVQTVSKPVGQSVIKFTLKINSQSNKTETA